MDPWGKHKVSGVLGMDLKGSQGLRLLIPPEYIEYGFG